MKHEDDPGNHTSDTDQENENPRQDRVRDGNAKAQDREPASGTHPKPPIPVRLWKALLRRRIWRRLAGHTPPNWAEKTAIYLTGAIALAAFVQIYVYWRQKEVMESSLAQNERAVILNMGQLAVSGRTASIGEQSLRTTVEQFHLDQRAWIALVDPQILRIDEHGLKIAFAFANSGKTPAKNVRTFVDWEPRGGMAELEVCKGVRDKDFRNAPYIAPQGRYILHDPTFDPRFYEDVENDYWQKRRWGTGLTYFCVYGTITYDDVANMHHHTNFCVYSNPNSIKDVGFCPGGFNDLN